MQIPPEAYPIIGTIMVAISYWVKRDADTKYTEAQSVFKMIQGLQQNIASQQKSINALYTTLAQYAQIIRYKERASERNYQLNRRTIDDNAEILMQHVSRQGRNLVAEIARLPAHLETSFIEITRQIAFTVGAEIGAAMSREFAMKNVERKLYPFPDSDDPRWRDDYITPTVPDVVLHKEPYFDDDVRLRKSCSKIAPVGENVRLIEEPSIKAVAVYKVENEVPCYGWLPEYSVRIGKPTPNDA